MSMGAQVLRDARGWEGGGKRQLLLRATDIAVTLGPGSRKAGEKSNLFVC